MFLNNLEMRVLVKGKPITEYFHRGQNFIEGRTGSAYEIEFRNGNPFRVEAIISVDGLSITDGKEAGPQSSGYLVEANQTVRIPGWKLNDAQVAAFEFSVNSASYATQSTGSARNNGVIGVMVYREQKAPPSPWNIPMYYNGNPNYNIRDYGGIAKGIAPVGLETFGGSLGVTREMSSSPVGVNVVNQSSYNPTQPYEDYFMASSANCIGSKVQSLPDEASLGTAFGEATNFQTSKAEFKRGDLVATIVCYYDSKRNLESRGIVIGRKQQKFAAQPQAFPAAQIGCVPPPNWDGARMSNSTDAAENRRRRGWNKKPV